MKSIKQYWYLIVITFAYLLLALLLPGKAATALSLTLHTIQSVVLIIAAVFVLIGLIQVWIKEDLIASRLGEGSGLKAIFISAAFGSMLAGPLFAIFPLLKSLLDRGARTGVIVAMLTTWAVKIPMLPLEIKFLGPYFALTRVALVLILAVPMSLLIEKIVTNPQAKERPDQAQGTQAHDIDEIKHARLEADVSSANA